MHNFKVFEVIPNAQHDFRFDYAVRKLIVHLRNSGAKLLGCDNVLVSTTTEKSETCVKGKECECVDGPTASSAAE